MSIASSPSSYLCHMTCRYKYLTAYIPVISFYYRGKVIYRFKATESYEELLEQVTKMTGKLSLLSPGEL